MLKIQELYVHGMRYSFSDKSVTVCKDRNVGDFPLVKLSGPSGSEPVDPDDIKEMQTVLKQALTVFGAYRGYRA